MPQQMKQLSLAQRLSTAMRAIVGGKLQERDLYAFRNPGVFFSQGKNTPLISQDTVMSIATVYACVTLISKMVAQLPMKVMQKTNAGPVELTDHAAYDLLKISPNGQTTSMQWIETNMVKLLLRGVSYNRVFRDRYFEPQEIYPLDTSKMEVLVDRTDGINRIKAYRYDGKNLELSDVLPFRGMSFDDVNFISPISYLRDTFTLALQQGISALQLYQNGLRASGFLKTEYVFGQEESDSLLASFTANYVGAVNSGKIVPLPKGVEFTKGESISPVDAQMLEGAKFTTTQIANIFGVPLHMIGGGDKVPAWGTGISQMQVGFLTNCLQPWIRRIETCSDLHLLTKEDRRRGIYTKIVTEGFVRSDPVVQMALFVDGLDSGIYSINEVRAWMDLGKLDAGVGDVHRISGTPAEDAPSIDIESSPVIDEEERKQMKALLETRLKRKSQKILDAEQRDVQSPAQDS
jgi:HK97 family phage portal protein